MCDGGGAAVGVIHLVAEGAKPVCNQFRRLLTILNQKNA
jgi:hypothetical protein